MAQRYGAVLVVGFALIAVGQDVQVAGPVTGWMYDEPSHALRLISGMPGAARIGSALLSDVEWASVAPGGSRALVQMKGEIRLYTSADVANRSEGAPVNGAIAAPLYSAWAPDSSAVAIYSPASRSAQWIRTNAQSAVADTPVFVTGVDGDVTAIAADSASGLMVVAVAGSGVYRLSQRSGAVLLGSIPDVSGVAIEPGGRRMWLADRRNASLTEVVHLNSRLAVTTLLTDSERLSDISAITLTPDRRLFLADRRTNRLYSFDPTTSTLDDGVELPAPAPALTPLGRDSVLLLGQRGQAGDPVYLLVVNRGTPPAVFFVPEVEAQ